LSFPGPIAGGATFELPTVTAHLTAGQSGTIQTKLGGTSYSDPGLTFKAVASTIIGDLTAPTACFPNPSPVFTTTTIG
ncbi:cyclase, partial [Amycolatopsis mediterranei]